VEYDRPIANNKHVEPATTSHHKHSCDWGNTERSIWIPCSNVARAL
jgi:hypothetical protein